MMRYVLILLCLLATLYGCSNVPDEQEIKLQVAKSALKSGGEKIFIFENFRKINGFSEHNNSYIAEVSYDLVFRKGLDELSLELKEQSGTSPLLALESGVELFTRLMQYGPFKAGDRIERHEKFRFLKTEQGWRLAEEFNL